MADACHVDPDLVGAAGLQPALDISERAKTLQYLIMSDSRTAVSCMNAHLLPVVLVPADGGVYGSCIRLQVAMDDGFVDPVDGMLL